MVEILTLVQASIFTNQYYLNGLTFCVIHFCVIHPDLQQSCTQVLCHPQSHVLCHTLFWSEFFCHTPPTRPDFLSYLMMLLLPWSMGAGTALVVHAKNSRPRWASNPHQTPWIQIKIFISACPFPKEEFFEDFLLTIHIPLLIWALRFIATILSWNYTRASLLLTNW